MCVSRQPETSQPLSLFQAMRWVDVLFQALKTTAPFLFQISKLFSIPALLHRRHCLAGLLLTPYNSLHSSVSLGSEGTQLSGIAVFQWIHFVAVFLLAHKMSLNAFLVHRIKSYQYFGSGLIQMMHFVTFHLAQNMNLYSALVRSSESNQLSGPDLVQMLFFYTDPHLAQTKNLYSVLFQSPKSNEQFGPDLVQRMYFVTVAQLAQRMNLYSVHF